MPSPAEERPAVARQLERCGWTVSLSPLDGRPSYEWRSPTGMSGPDFRSDTPDDPPPAVIDHAVRNGSLTGG